MATTYITTVKSSGGDYTSLAGWEAGYGSNTGTHDGDLITADAIEVAECYSFQDVATVTIDGWDTSATQYIKAYTPSGERSATGIYDTSKYRLECDDGCLSINESYVYLEGIQAKVTRSTENYPSIVAYWNMTGSTDCYIDKCILQANSTGGNDRRGVAAQDSDCVLTIRNTIIQDITGGNNSHLVYVDTAATVNIYNCTLFGGYTGILASAGTITATNCAIFDNDVDINGSVTLTYCAGDDAEFDSGTGNIGWDGTSTDWNANFTEYDASPADVSVKDTDADIYNAGTDLSGSGVTDDIIGTARPQAGTYDIGAFEFVGAPSGWDLRGGLSLMGIGL